jgi:hypothetical protein
LVARSCRGVALALCFITAGTLLAAPPSAAASYRVANHLTTADGLPSNWLRDVLATEDGLWVATEQSGLCYLQKGRAPRTFTHAADGLPSDSVSSLALYRGKVYAGGEGGLAVYDGERWEVLDIVEKVKMREVLVAVDASRDELWAEAMHVGGGLVKFNGERWSFFGGDGKGLINNVTAFAFQGDTLWLGTVGSGVYRITGGDWKFVRSGDGLRGDTVTALAIQGKDLWVGTFTGAGRLRDGAWRWAGAEEGLNPSNVKDILAVGEDLLVGTTGGLFQLEGEDAAVRPIPLPAEGAEPPQVGRIREDAGREVVWVATTRGLFELKRQ